MGHSDSKPQAPPQMSFESAQRGVPPVIRVAYKKSWSKIIAHLSEPDSDPRYCVYLPQGWYGEMLLHDGAEPECPVLARAKGEGKWRQDFAIALPMLPGAGENSSLEILRWKAKRKEQFWFAMELGQGANKAVERFEWRRSHGSEVKSVGESKYGWKLVRLGRGAGDPGSSDDEKDHGPDRMDGLTSDGREIVAVWADSGDWKSVSKIGEFQLRGSGATGELGTQWALMAVMSCMCIWQKSMATSTTTATVAAAS
ncbi:hypothetical protein ACJ41O_001093 [Fusarium nematophilum]